MRAVLSCVIALVLACSPSPRSDVSDGDVRLSVEPVEVSAGDSIKLVLDNQSSDRIGYNLCTSALERSRDSDWEAVPSDRVCTMELRTLPPGEQARYPLSLPSGLAAGEYRYTTKVERLETGDRSDLRSDTFRVDS